MQRSRKLTTGVPCSRRPFVFAVVFLVLSTSILAQAGRAAGSSGESDLAAFIAREFPDRKTSGYDSQRLVSYLSGQLQAQGWTAEVQPYSMLVRTSAPKPLNAQFIQVGGENVLAYRVAPSPSDGVDILLVAPYDLLFREPDDLRLMSYTARSTGILLGLALGLSAPKDDLALPNVAIAFVSGHYQYGAGIQALIDDLTKRGARVSAALVIGDVDALSGLPLSVSESTPVGLTLAVYRAARKRGLQVTVVGSRSREAWYRATLNARGGAFSAESAFDNGGFKGEASVLAASGIPVLTVGAPRNNLASARNAQGDKARKVAGALRDFLGSSVGDLAGILTRGPIISERVLLQVAGNVFFLPRKALQIAGPALGLAALIVLRLDARRRDLTPLALLGGTLAAFTAAHPLHRLWFSWGRGYVPIKDPGSALFLYLWCAATLLMLGFLRLWHIRTRIAVLHSRYPARAVPPVPSTGSGVGLDGADGNVSPEGIPPAGGVPPAGGASNRGTRTWAGPWGLAVIVAVLAGMALIGSEIAPAAAVAVVCVSIAIGLDRCGHRVWVPWIQRLLCAASLLPLVFWAGPPFGDDALSVYASSTAGLGIESVSFTLSLAVMVACLVSTFHLPAPPPPKSLRFNTVLELGVIALMVALGIAVPGAKALDLPTQAAIREFYGNEGRLTVETTRPLGEIRLFPGGTQPRVSGMPSTLVDTALSTSIRLVTVPSSWAEMRLNVEQTDKGKEETRYRGKVWTGLTEKPTFFEVRFQDVPAARTLGQPFRLSNVAAILGVEARSSPIDITLKPASGYSVTFTWWMPKEPLTSVPFDVELIPVSTRLDVTGRAVYFDRSYSGASPSADEAARFLQVTTVTGAWSLR
jgi:hypothetical protein